MKKAKWSLWLVPLLVLGFFFGCTKDQPTQATFDSIEILTFQGADVSVTGGHSLYVEEWIEASEGGELELEYDNHFLELSHSVEIAANALPHDTLVSMTLMDPFVAEVIFEPSDVTFSIPVEVKLEYKSHMIHEQPPWNLLGVYRYNEDTYQWEEIPSSLTLEEGELELEFELDHFSRYAVGRP